MQKGSIYFSIQVHIPPFRFQLSICTFVRIYEAADCLYLIYNCLYCYFYRQSNWLFYELQTVFSCVDAYTPFNRPTLITYSHAEWIILLTMKANSNPIAGKCWQLKLLRVTNQITLNTISAFINSLQCESWWIISKTVCTFTREQYVCI